MFFEGGRGVGGSLGFLYFFYKGNLWEDVWAPPLVFTFLNELCLLDFTLVFFLCVHMCVDEKGSISHRNLSGSLCTTSNYHALFLRDRPITHNTCIVLLVRCKL